MKILAIRGRNLASLGGVFELDLGSAPFDRAGLFAITGPVGAGKSTLLDAVCLALFDRTPRLTGRGGAPVGSQHDEGPLRLGSNDVRTVLRRGAADGYAEVDFRGCDGGSYRARWSVRRARRRVEGRLQQQQVSLTDVDTGQVLQGDRKQDALSVIQEKLGLSFDQFRRSVMLAQGDFAAFLKSDAKDRAELLERMTGTEIYRQISQRAYEKHQEESRKLTLLQETVQIQQPLPDSERARLDQDHELAQHDLQRLALEESAASQACEWYATLEQLAKLTAEAKVSSAKTRAVWEGTAELRERLDVVQAAQPLRPMLETVDRARKELSKVVSSQNACAAELNTAQKEEAEHAKVFEKAEADLQEAESRDKELGPGLKAAHQLDIRLAEAEKVVLANETQDRELGSALAEVTVVVDDLRAELAGSRARDAELRGWLADNDTLAKLGKGWDQHRADLGHFRRTLDQTRGLQERAAAIDADLDAARAVLREAEVEASNWRGKLTQVRAAAERAGQAARAVSTVELRRRQKSSSEHREVLIGQQRVIREAQGLSEQRAEIRARVEDARRRSAAAAAQAEQQLRAGETVAAGLAEAQRALRKAESARSLQDHRRELVEGEACPLCGSTHHPAAHEPFADLLTEQRQRVTDLTRQRDASAVAEATSRAEHSSWEERQAGLERDADAVIQSLRGLVDQCGRGEDPLAKGVGETVEQRIQEVDKALAELEAEREQAEALLLAAQQAATALQNTQEAWQVAIDALETAKLRERKAESGSQEVDGELRVLDTGRGEILARLAPAFDDRPRWREELRENPTRFADICAERVALFSSRSEELTALQTRSGELRQKLAEQEALQCERAGSRDKLAEQLARQRQELEVVKGKRAALLGGRPTVEVESEVATSLQKARKLREESAQSWKRAGVKQAEAMVRFQHATRSRELQRQALEEAEGRLSFAAESAEIPLDDVPARLRHDRAWIRAREREVATRKRDMERADTILAERQSRRLQHEANGRPSLSADKARETLRRTQAAISKANAELARLRMEVARDDDARQRLAELGPKLEAQTEVLATWRALNELIGSARGDRFQVFAQSLTLDTLLARANHHLRELARRYRLVRVPGTDLDLQVVDQEMGETARSIHSLSGGESFLVSLALALGLSSLSARRTPIETLFIDEGFGALDPVSLETALSALDALQATGRQVGIVSHVDGLAERIGVSVQVVPEGGGRSRLLRSGRT